MTKNQRYPSLDRHCAPLGATFAVTVVLTLVSSAAQAQTQVDADLQRYCREKFPNSIYEKRAENWGVEHYCNQGGTRQGIDYAEACRMTTGSPAFRRDGDRVYCLGHKTSKPAANAAGEVDLARYCRKAFPNSTYEWRAENWGVTHYCRRPGATGGFTLQQIDLAKACRELRGSSEYQKVGHRIFCGSAADTASQGTYKWPQTGFIYHGPLKNGKPNGIGWTRIDPTGAIQVGEFRGGKLIGAYLDRRKGQLTCWDYGAYAAGRSKFMKQLPISRCAHLQKVMAKVP